MECMFLAPASSKLVSQILIEYCRFQWAKLQMDQLLSLPCASDIRDFLGKLPEDLERAYDEILDRINSQKGRTPEIARRSFLWVMCSLQPLTPGALVQAVCQDPETRSTNPVDININIVLEACRGLLMIDQSGVCRFSHLSVQEYLETCRYSNGQAHLVVGTVCLQMLLNPTNWQILESSLSGDGGLVNSFFDRGPAQGAFRNSIPFSKSILRYAVANWPDHVRLHAEECVDDFMRSLLKEFLGSPKEGSSAYICWSRAFSRWFYKRCRFELLTSVGPAYAVVWYSLNQVLYNWWTSNINVDSLDDEGRSLLYIAVLTGNLTAAAELLDRGANPNIKDKVGRYALYEASYGGNKALVHLLLDRGADINAQSRSGNALGAAVFMHREGIIRLLLDRGADINGGHYGSALYLAVDIGSEAIVRLLLDRGADVNAQGGYLGNALQAAAVEASEAIARLLIDRGADINARSGYYGNALQAFSLYGKEAIVRLLLDRGADINAQGGYYGNALQAAASRGSEAIVRLLLDRGADINAQGGYHGNALQAAASKHSETNARLLLDRGADINAQGGYHGNALQAASSKGSEAINRIRLVRRADINAQDGHCESVLYVPVNQNSEAIVRLLLDRGADINAQGGYHGNALQGAAYEGSEAIIRLLLERGADINAQGGHYGNALHAARHRHRQHITSLLQDRGADIDSLKERLGSCSECRDSPPSVKRAPSARALK